jgi:hypothetical protein
MALESVDRDVVAKAVAKYRDSTDLTFTAVSTPVLSGSGETDIIFQESSSGLPESVRGATWCNDAVDGTSYDCDQQYIRIRGDGAYTQTVTSHEMGHAFGLLHGPNASPAQSNGTSTMGIMRTPVSAITSTDLGSTVISNINFHY